jgi:hypothetical protein
MSCMSTRPLNRRICGCAETGQTYKLSTSGFGGSAQVFYSVWDFSVAGTPPETGDSKKKK